MVSVLVLASLALPGTLKADVLPLGGSFGTADGCLYARTGVPTNEDTLFLLTPNEVSTAVSVCQFRKVLASSARGYAVQAACSARDSGEQADIELDIQVSEYDRITVKLAEGASWGPLGRCP